MIEYEGTVTEDGEITFTGNVRRDIQVIYCGQDIKLKITRLGKKRSTPQNSYLWGVVYNLLADEFNKQEPFTYSANDIHECMKQKFLGEDIVNRDTGEYLYRKTRSTTELTTEGIYQLYRGDQEMGVRVFWTLYSRS